MLYVAIVILCLVAAFLWRASKGPAYRIEQLNEPIRGLLRQGFDGGVLFIHRYRKLPFLQLSKYIVSPGEYGIELGFPMAKWSEGYFSLVEAFCEQSGIEYTKQPASLDEGSMVFLDVDFGKDVGKAHIFVSHVLTKIFGWDEHRPCFASLQNADHRDVVVDRKHIKK